MRNSLKVHNGGVTSPLSAPVAWFEGTPPAPGSPSPADLAVGSRRIDGDCGVREAELNVQEVTALVGGNIAPEGASPRPPLSPLLTGETEAADEDEERVAWRSRSRSISEAPLTAAVAGRCDGAGK